MTPIMKDALAEIMRSSARNPGVLFWWRQASMRKLQELGFVAPHPKFSHMKRPAWIVTPTGRAALEAEQ